MVKNRLQNKVAGSELTFPVCIITAVAMWWWPQQAVSAREFVGLLLCLLTAFVLMETNTRQHIIRIRTRMMSCVWLILSASLSFMHPLGEPLVAATFLCISYMLLFRCYGKRRPQLTVFHAFVMLGLGSFCAPAMLLMVVPYFLYIAIFLRSLTHKAFWAGILGVAVPYWCYGVWCFTLGDIEDFTTRMACMASHDLPSLEAITSLPLVSKVSAGVVALLGIVSILHYLNTNYDDKIRVRMILYICVANAAASGTARPAACAVSDHYGTARGKRLATHRPLRFTLEGHRQHHRLRRLSAAHSRHGSTEPLACSGHPPVDAPNNA